MRTLTTRRPPARRSTRGLGAVALGLLSWSALAPHARISVAAPAVPTTSLFSGVVAFTHANRVLFRIEADGRVTDRFDNALCGGGWGSWPAGGCSGVMVFASGFEVAAVIPATAGFPWAGDTVGAHFQDFRGNQVAGESVSPVVDAADPLDRAAWPAGAVVRDAALYHPVLLDRPTISDQDVWTRYWDGNPRSISGRQHPMGLLVEQRALV